MSTSSDITSVSYIGQGAATGYAIGGGWGAVVGAVVGGIAGSINKEAEAQFQKARRREVFMKDLQAAQQRRNIVLQAYMKQNEMAARAGAEEGGLTSSGYRGGSSSIQTQMREGLGVFDQVVAWQRQAEKFMKKGGNKKAISDTIMQMVSMAGSMGGGMGGKK